MNIIFTVSIFFFKRSLLKALQIHPNYCITVIVKLVIRHEAFLALH